MGEQTSWKSFVEKLEYLPEPPGKNYLNAAEFARRAGVQVPALRQQLRRGKIQLKHMVKIDQYPGKSNGMYSVLIDWNATAYDYIKSKPKAKWPDDFSLNDRSSYKRIVVIGDLKKVEPTQEPETNTPAISVSIDDIATLDEAKLELAKEKLRQERAASARADNETMTTDDMAIIMTSIGYEVKAQILRLKGLLGHKIAGKSSIAEINSIIEVEFMELIDSLGPLLTKATLKGLGYDEGTEEDSQDNEDSGEPN